MWKRFGGHIAYKITCKNLLTNPRRAWTAAVLVYMVEELSPWIRSRAFLICCGGGVRRVRNKKTARFWFCRHKPQKQCVSWWCMIKSVRRWSPFSKPGLFQSKALSNSTIWIPLEDTCPPTPGQCSCSRGIPQSLWVAAICACFACFRPPPCRWERWCPPPWQNGHLLRGWIGFDSRPLTTLPLGLGPLCGNCPHDFPRILIIFIDLAGAPVGMPCQTVWQSQINPLTIRPSPSNNAENASLTQSGC